MSTVVGKMYDLTMRLRRVKISRGPKFLVYFILISFFSLNMLNAYAQEEQSSDKPLIDLQEVYKGQGEVVSASVGTNQPNSDATVSNQLTGIVATGVRSIGGAQLVVSEKELSKLNIDEGSKLGLLGVVDKNMKMALYAPPSIDVLQHFAEEWVPGQKEDSYSTFAASGYDYLSSMNIARLWDIVRNICYVFFVLILIIAGFMIMFRQKIGGQVAITVYNTIPNVIIGLVLVTFSFAIVGVVLDVAALAMRLIAGVFNYGSASDYVYLSTPFGLLEGGRRASTSIDASALATAAYNSAQGSVGQIGGLLGSILSGAIAGLIGLVIALIVLILFLYAAIKVFITVFKAFLGIIFDTILAPIYLTMSAIPGKESSRVEWFNRVLKNAAVFPVVFFLVNLPGFFQANGMILDLTGIGNGTLAPVTGVTGFTETLIAGLLPLFMYFAAAEVPKYLSDIFPSNAPKGAAEAMASMKKMPLIGGFF